uniref:Uncharacterized protein n=1 Tax=Leersia perrieri TaxID=77586 RepID=A0A0D9XTZ6_9ORYZ
MRCFCRPRSFDYEIQSAAYNLYCVVVGIDPQLELSSSEVVAGAHHDDLVGIDGPAEELLRWLMVADNGDMGVKIKAIVGPAGIGKTTLAMEVHRRLQSQNGDHFQCCVVAKSVPDKSRLLQTILSQIMDQEALSTPDSQTVMMEDTPELLAQLADKISEVLSDKRYFAILDHISYRSDWEMIERAFPKHKDRNRGSRILFTTRDERIAEDVRSEQTKWIAEEYSYSTTVYIMKPLNFINSKMLLRMTAFVGSMDDCPTDNLELLCEEILAECKGMPLLITCMADWLNQQQQQHDSSAVPRAELVGRMFNHFLEKLSSGRNNELCLQSLYLSMFPQGYVFDRDDLIIKWLEQGGKKDYNIAGDLAFFKLYGNPLSGLYLLSRQKLYTSFSKLVDWNIITPVAENPRINHGGDDLCLWQINPLMRRFLASIAAENGYVFTSSTLSSAPRSGGKNTRIARRLALHNPDPRLPEMLQQMDLSHTRSLVISGLVNRTTIPLDKFAYLVLLDLEGWKNLKDEDLLQICKMFMLRYLSIRNTGISKLPPQIKELCILRTLDISQTHITELPLEVCELTFLIMLNLTGTRIRQLPEKIVQLDQLEYFLFGGIGSAMIYIDETVLTKMPETMFSLHTLATIDLSELSAKSVESLGYLSRLRVLEITWSFHQCVDKAYQEALRSSMKGWKNLESLTIHCGLGCSMEFMASLSDPPNELEKFKVTAGRFVSVPRWIKEHQNLAFLQITVCRLVQDDVKILADLVKLKHLVLCLEFIPEKEIVIESEGFRKLQKISFECPVPWLSFKEGTMPWLEYLKLKICSGPANQDIVVPSGLTNLRWIKEVVICYSKWCSNSSSIKRTVEAVKKQVAMHRDPIDLVINGVPQKIEALDGETERATGSGTKGDAEALDEETKSGTKIGTEDCVEILYKVTESQIENEIEDDVQAATQIQSEIEEIEDEIMIQPSSQEQDSVDKFKVKARKFTNVLSFWRY